MLRAILLDLDDTLLDFHRAEADALRETLLQLGIEPNNDVIVRYSAINAKLWTMLEEKKVTREQVLLDRFRILFSTFGIEREPTLAKELYAKQLALGHSFLPGAKELLETLFPFYQLYIVSNGTAAIQDRRIADAGIARYFDGIFISQRIGYDKPHPEFFDYCFRHIPDFSHDSTIILGDSLTSDIRGGNLAGIHTCWLNPHGKPGRADIVPQYEISNLSEFPALLQTIQRKNPG